MKIILLTPAMLERAARELLVDMPAGERYSLNGRLERGLALALEGAVTPLDDPDTPWRANRFRVRSSHPSIPPYHYRVDLDAMTCECPDYANGYHCKHLIAAQIIVQAQLDCLAARYA